LRERERERERERVGGGVLLSLGKGPRDWRTFLSKICREAEGELLRVETIVVMCNLAAFAAVIEDAEDHAKNVLHGFSHKRLNSTCAENFHFPPGSCFSLADVEVP